MFCPHCGAHNNDSATVCAECGQALKTSDAATPIDEPTPPPLDEPTPPPFGAPNAPAQTTPPPRPSATDPAAAAHREGAHARVTPAVGTDTDDDPEAIDTGATVLLAIAAVIVPLLGIILYFVWHRSQPRTARQMLMFGLVNLVLLFGLYRFAS